MFATQHMHRNLVLRCILLFLISHGRWYPEAAGDPDGADLSIV
jgi:hypothetical protein